MRKQKRRQIIKDLPKTMWHLLVNGRYEFTFDLAPIKLQGLPWEKRINLLKAGLHLFYRKLRPLNRPFNMIIELTNYCNLRCPVCPTGAGELSRRPQAISVALFERVMEQWGRYLLTIALFAWGEPLLHPQLKKILEIASRYPIVTRLSTNGQNLSDEKVIDALISYPPTYLIVALDGLTDETNAKYRIGARLAPALSGVKRLADWKKEQGKRLPVLHMRYIVMKHNEHELPEVRKFAADHQFELLSIRSLSNIDAADHSSRDAMVPEIKHYRAVQSDGAISNFTCDYPFVFPTMLADGTIVPCDQDYNGQMPLGRVAEDGSLDQLWFGRQASHARKTIRDKSQNLSFCRNCPYQSRTTDTCSVEIFNVDPHFEAPVIGSSA
jgi:radical SAM protein with 4Fe4S-binding SPASM domain